MRTSYLHDIGSLLRCPANAALAAFGPLQATSLARVVVAGLAPHATSRSRLAPLETTALAGLTCDVCVALAEAFPGTLRDRPLAARELAFAGTAEPTLGADHAESACASWSCHGCCSSLGGFGAYGSGVRALDAALSTLRPLQAATALRTAPALSAAASTGSALFETPLRSPTTTCSHDDPPTLGRSWFKHELGQGPSLRGQTHTIPRELARAQPREHASSVDGSARLRSTTLLALRFRLLPCRRVRRDVAVFVETKLPRLRSAASDLPYNAFAADVGHVRSFFLVFASAGTDRETESHSSRSALGSWSRAARDSCSCRSPRCSPACTPSDAGSTRPRQMLQGRQRSDLCSFSP